MKKLLMKVKEKHEMVRETAQGRERMRRAELEPQSNQPAALGGISLEFRDPRAFDEFKVGDLLVLKLTLFK